MNKHNKIHPISDDNLITYHDYDLVCIIDCNTDMTKKKKTNHVHRNSSVPTTGKKYNIFSITELSKKYKKCTKMEIIVPTVHVPNYLSNK